MSHEQYEPPRHLRFDEHKLYVVAVCSNPERYASRFRLFREFQARMRANPDVVLVTVEQAFGERPFEVTHCQNQLDIQIRAGAESTVWVKESLINIGFRQLARICPDWRYAAWIDGDVEFLRPDWARETIHALQQYKIVQPWAHAVDQGPHFAPIGHSESFCKSYWDLQSQLAAGENPSRNYTGKRVNGVDTWHPGYAWAIRRSTWEKIGPFIDWCVMGSGDRHMACAFIGKVEHAIHDRATASYKRLALAFQRACDKHLERDIGYVAGMLVHHFHGKKRERYYVQRTKTLADVGFDPDRDVKLNHDGLLVLTGHNLRLRDALRRYLKSRNEDSVDLD